MKNKIRLAILCPGQGEQDETLFDLALTSEIARTWLQEGLVEPYLTAPLRDVVEHDNLLFKNQNAQQLIVTATYAEWIALKDQLPPPIAFLGYSVGELSTYACADAVPIEKLFELVAKRIWCMDEVKPHFPEEMGLMAVSGLTFEQIQSTMEKHSLHLAIANEYNAFILGGLQSHFESAVPEFRQIGAKTTMLRVDVSSHTPLMKQASRDFGEYLESFPLSDPIAPVVAGISGELVTTPEVAKKTLTLQVMQSVRFISCLHALAEMGPTCVLEIGPGRAIAKMFRDLSPAIPCRATRDFRTIEGIVEWVREQGK